MNELEHLSGGEHHLKVEPNVKPVITPDRSTCFHSSLTEDRTATSLKDISSVIVPTEAVSQIVAVTKESGQLWICTVLGDTDSISCHSDSSEIFQKRLSGALRNLLNLKNVPTDWTDSSPA